jgi:hypothetical protein
MVPACRRVRPFRHGQTDVAEYQLLRALPEFLDTNLPTIAQLEEELNAEVGGDNE